MFRFPFYIQLLISLYKERGVPLYTSYYSPTSSSVLDMYWSVLRKVGVLFFKINNAEITEEVLDAQLPLSLSLGK